MIELVKSLPSLSVEKGVAECRVMLSCDVHHATEHCNAFGRREPSAPFRHHVVV